MELLRSLLFVPGNRPDMLEKAKNFQADVLVPDMEDSVPVAEKANARKIVAAALPGLAGAGKALFPRPNALNTGLLADDLAAVIGPHIEGVTVGKVSSAWEVRQIVSIVEPLEKKTGLPAGHVKIIPWIETAKAIVNAYEICAASPRVIAVAFGGEDFTNDMEIHRSDEGSELVYPRNVIAVAAKAAGVIALDTPYVNFRDPEGHKRDILVARRMGFRGKFAIHPSQVSDINALFAPSPEEVEQARRIVAAFQEAEAAGKGSTSVDGKMIDAPVVKRAQALLAQSEAIAKGQSLPRK